MKKITVRMTEEEFNQWTGCKAEQKFFKEELMPIAGKFNLTKQDFVLIYKNKIYIIEFKNKLSSSFKDYKDGFEGYGINKSQYENYMKLFKKFDIRCLLYIDDEKKNKCFLQWLDILKNYKHLKSEKCNTFIFDIKEFIEVDKVVWKRNIFSLIKKMIESG